MCTSDLFSEDEADLDPTLPNINVTFKDVIEAINDLSASAAPGPDYFPSIINRYFQIQLRNRGNPIYLCAIQLISSKDELNLYRSPIIR